MIDCSLQQLEDSKWCCPICDPGRQRLLPVNARRNCGIQPLPNTPIEPRVKGPGDHLHVLILKKFGHAVVAGCGCSKWIAKMNQGPEWCRKHADEIAAHLVKQAKKAGYKRALLPGAHTYCKRRLVLPAIRMAEEAVAATLQ